MSKVTFKMSFYVHKTMITPLAALQTVCKSDLYGDSVSGEFNYFFGRHNIPPSATPWLRIPGFYPFPVLVIGIIQVLKFRPEQAAVIVSAHFLTPYIC